MYKVIIILIGWIKKKSKFNETLYWHENVHTSVNKQKNDEVKYLICWFGKQTELNIYRKQPNW